MSVRRAARHADFGHRATGPGGWGGKAAAGFPPRLEPGEVHVWSIDLTANGSADAAAALTGDDLARAGRFVFERDRTRFVRARSALREILAAYTAIEPRALPILFNPHGKPYFDFAGAPGFNLSHSGDIALLAVGTACGIGVDVEARELPRDARELAATVFSPEERDALHCVADHALSEAFFTCWTRKEAVLKALGVGLTLDPAAITVGLTAVRRTVPAGKPGTFATVETIISDDRCVASLAVVGGHARTIVFEHAALLNPGESARWV